MSQNVAKCRKNVFRYFSTTTGWNHSRFSAFAKCRKMSKMSQNVQNVAKCRKNVFGYFSTTTGWNHSRFSAFATFYFVLTENRQAKPGKSQIGSLKNFSSYTFYTLGTLLKNTYFPQELFISRFPDVRYSSKRNVIRCNNFIHLTGVVSIISFDVITQVYGVLYSGLCITKESQWLNYQFILGKG